MPETTAICRHCGKVIDAANWDDAEQCPECLGCVLCDECTRNGEVTWVYDNEVYRTIAPRGNIVNLCPSCFQEVGFTCAGCEVQQYTDCGIYTGSDGHDYCEGCFDNRFCYCDDCGDAIRRGTGGYCSCCAEDHYDDDDDCDDDSNEFDAAIFRGRDEYSRMVSRRRFGVEIETHRCHGHMSLENRMPFGAKYDGSICGKEFASAILAGDAGLEAIDDLCEFADNHSWEVNNSCGLHVHLDASGNTLGELKAMALGYYITHKVWQMFVKPGRNENHYCRDNQCDMSDILSTTSFDRFSDSQSRYEWCNFAAYGKFRTFEIRLHHGTLDKKAICNWVRVHAIFMDWAQSRTPQEVKRTLWCIDVAEQFEFIMGLCVMAGAGDLVEYYTDKAKQYGHENTISRALVSA